MDTLQKGYLRIIIKVHPNDSKFYWTQSIPKQIEIFFSDLKLERSFWLLNDNWQAELTVGLYLIKINLPSGKEFEKIVEVSPQQNTNVSFEISIKNSFAEKNREINDNERGILFEDIPLYNYGISDINDKVLSAKLWRYSYQKWFSVEETKSFFYSFNDGEGILSFDRDSFVVLQIDLDLKKSIYIRSGGKYFVFKLESTNNVINHNDVNLSILLQNEVAQALLSLMNHGDISKAKTLFNGNDAEKLLLQKIADPIAAAVGGYFLLKIGELDKMHDWANNLANWFEWMPDGPIIHAWQLIHLQDFDDKFLIANRLIEAAERGIPFFTEGLRLLYEGLNMLSYEFGQNYIKVEVALKKVRKLMEAADLSKAHTTLSGNKDFLLMVNDL